MQIFMTKIRPHEKIKGYYICLLDLLFWQIDDQDLFLWYMEPMFQI